MTTRWHRCFWLTGIGLAVLLAAVAAQPAAAQPSADKNNIRLLFLGDQGHHRPAERAAQLIPVLRRRGIEIEYTENVDDLNPDTLAPYDGLILYANIERISPEQEQALLQFVAGGKGFVPLHCASYCFLNSEQYVRLVGAQFQRHGSGVFRTDIARGDHPLMKGFGGFESWDETYVHHRHHEENRTVLEYRVDAEGREPWTWVRTHGRGRVFYTAWGHDQRTWGHAGFQNLVERGIRWAVGADPGVVPQFLDAAAFPVPRMTAPGTDLKPFQFVPAKVPYYPPDQRWGTLGEPITRMQQPLPPDESARHIVVPEGFAARLFAAEPDITKPICMAWDERGRLWIGETVDYPNQLQPAGRGRDRIKICADTDGDGRADKFTVFADQLSIPTAIAFYRGGVIVQDGTRTLYLKDTDGDDRADQRRVLFSGWNMRDTHGGVSNFRYGLDNWMWAMQGYNPSQPTAAGNAAGPPLPSFRMGFFRFRPDASQLEFVRSTNNNTWGLGLSEEGIVFGSTANRNPSVYMPIPNRYYERVRGWSAGQLGTIADSHLFQPITKNIRQVDHHGGYTAGAGHALYTARAYPAEYWNRTAFVCGPTGHLVGTFVLRGAGADFRSFSPCNLLASDDQWTAPIAAEVGPDGNVWVIDWYNYIVQHNPTPAGFETGPGNAYETELRDKRHGRIYRVVYEKAAPSPPLSLHAASPPQLVDTLRHDNMLWRLHAQRLLVERGKSDVVPLLVELVRDPRQDEIGLNVGAIHALWTLHGLGTFAAAGGGQEAYAAARAALRHPSAGVRRNAALVLPPREASLTALLEAELWADPDPQVRLAALLALADMPSHPLAGAALAQLVAAPEELADPWLADAATTAAAAHELPFLEELLSRPAELPPRARQLARTVAEHYARGPLADSAAALVEAFPRADVATVTALLEGLAAGWPAARPARLSGDAETALVELMPQLPVAGQVRLLKLASLWKAQRLAGALETLAKTLAEVVVDEKQADERRLEVARQLVELRADDEHTVRKILSAVSPRTPPALAAGLIEAVAQSQAPRAGPLLIEQLSALTPQARRAAQRALLSRADWTAALLEAAEAGRVALADLALDEKQALAAHPDRRIAARAKTLLARGGGLPSADRQKVLDQLLPLVVRQADAAAGQEVFKKQCAKCHVHGDEGQRIGPDLTGMAVHPKRELLTHIIDPSRSVEGNYRVYSLVTTAGRVLTGLLAGETRTSVELFDAEGKRHVVLRDEIDELVASPKSLMPDGFEKQATPGEIADLLEFLTLRGKFLPVPLAGRATIVSTRGMFFRRDAGVERLIFPDWSPKEFAGVPFHLVDPQGDRVPNVIMLYGPRGQFPPQMPKSVSLPCNAPARAIHLLSGVSGWGYPAIAEDSVSLIVRLHYDDGQAEDHALRNAVHFADYIRRVDVPQSQFAFALRGQQVRYLAVHPQRRQTINTIELVKGPDESAPVVMAVTVETP